MNALCWTNNECMKMQRAQIKYNLNDLMNFFWAASVNGDRKIYSHQNWIHTHAQQNRNANVENGKEKECNQNNHKIQISSVWYEKY